VDLLLEFGADVNRAIRYARTPIFVLICGLSGYQKPRQLSELPQAAMESGLKVDESSQLIARTLMKHGADVNGRDDIGKSPLWYAVSRGFTTVVEELLRDPGVRQDLERTYGPPESSKTVVEAAISGKGEHYPRYHMVKVLLEAGADRNRTRRFRTPLSQAISLGYIELLKLLMLPECINLQLDHGSTALFVTVGAGYIETTRYLLSMRADPNIQDAIGRAALHIVASANSRTDISVSSAVQLVSMLLDHGANPNTQDVRGYTPFLFAAENRNWNMIREILARNIAIDVNLIGLEYYEYAELRQGFPPLALAVWDNQYHIVEALLDNAADPNARGPRDETALHKAATLPDEDGEAMVELLVNRGAWVGAVDQQGPKTMAERDYLGCCLGLKTHSFRDSPQATVPFGLLIIPATQPINVIHVHIHLHPLHPLHHRSPSPQQL